MKELFIILALISFSCSNPGNPLKKNNSQVNPILATEKSFFIEDPLLYSPSFINGLKELNGSFKSLKLVGNKMYTIHESYNGVKMITSFDTIKIPSLIPPGVETKYKAVTDSSNFDLSLKMKNLTTLNYILKNNEKIMASGEVVLIPSFFLASESLLDENGHETGGMDYFSDNDSIRLRISLSGDLVQINNEKVPLLKKEK
jgi:hypothetical protein